MSTIVIKEKNGFTYSVTRSAIITCFDAKVTAHRTADKYSVSFVVKVQRYWGDGKFFSTPGRAEAIVAAEKAMKQWEEKRWKEFDGELVNISEITKVTVEIVAFQAQKVIKEVVGCGYFTIHLEDLKCPPVEK